MNGRRYLTVTLCELVSRGFTDYGFLKIAWLLAVWLGVLVVAVPSALGQLFEADSKRFGNSKMDIVLKEIERRPRASVVEIKINSVGSSVGSSFFILCSVRHAKREYEGEDPPLTPVGIARAEALATTLRDAGISAIITTELRRARDTAQPLARALGIKPEIVSLGDYDAAAHPEAVAAAVRRHNDENVLVVGHITVTGVIAALGGPRLPTICENGFSYLFLFTPGAGEDGLLRLRYGAAEDISPRCK